MSVFRPPDPRSPRPRRAAILVFLVALALSACGGGSTPRPTIPPDATGSLLPAATATPPSSASPAASVPAAVFPVTLAGDDGTSVELKAAPRKIISLTPAETEVLFAIDAGDEVVGKVEDPAKYPPEADAVPVFGTFAGVDIEKVVGAGADLVIAGGNGGTPQDAIDKLRSLHVPVLVVYASDVKGVLHDIELTGAATGHTVEAAQIVASMQAGFDQVAAATTGLPRPRVFYETGDSPAIYGIADQTVYADMVGLAGATPITTGSTTNWEMPAEKLLAADPELIILGDSAYGTTADAVAKRPGWASLTAVKAGAIKPIEDILVTRPGPRLVEGLRLLVAAIHPDVLLPSVAPVASGG